MLTTRFIQPQAGLRQDRHPLKQHPRSKQITRFSFCFASMRQREICRTWWSVGPKEGRPNRDPPATRPQLHGGLFSTVQHFFVDVIPCWG